MHIRVGIVFLAALASAIPSSLRFAYGAPAAAGDLLFNSEVEIPLRQSTTFPSDSHFTGGKGIVDIDGRGQPCVIEFGSGTVLEDMKFRVHGGAVLTLRNVWLIHCQIEVEPLAIVDVVGSGFHDCEFAGHDQPVAGISTFKLNNCQLIACRFLSPLNYLGLQLQDCTVRDHKGVLTLRLQKSANRAAMARDPLVRYTKFENCQLQPLALLATANCSFKGCTTVGLDYGLASDTSSDVVHLPVRWEDGDMPDAAGIGGGVILKPVTEALSGGSSFAVVSNGYIPSPAEGFASFSAPAVPLIDHAQKSTGAVARAGTADLKLQQTHVNGLLVATLDGGKQAGAISKMNLTATPGASNITFTQTVGNDMSAALNEVRKFMHLRHGALPDQTSLQIAFEEKYSGKDGPSAAVACGLLMESAFTGTELDPAFAVTGDMNADGLVQPIGGVAAKMRGATRGACKIIAIPSRNESAIADLIVREGPRPLAAINVFGISKFDEALALASAAREGPLQEAVAEMEVIQQALKRDPAALIPILRTPQAAARLQSVLTKAPHCLSAKYLLLYSQGRQPKFLTLAGSIEAADTDAEGLVAAIDSDFGSAANSLRQDELGGNLNRLRNLRPRLDQRVWPYVDGLVSYGEVLRGVILNPIRSASRAQEVSYQAKQAAGTVNSAKKQLIADPAVREELGL